jgi:hypothetical protein
MLCAGLLIYHGVSRQIKVRLGGMYEGKEYYIQHV